MTTADVETLGIIEGIEALISDKLQVVSYKWLSRNYLVSSNTAKRLLQEFVKNHGSELEVVYTLAGWLKNSPSVYHIRLVSEPKLAEAKQEFDGNLSIQVYSVQSCIPKDPAALWNTEYEQAEELCKQPSTADNCLRDNRFCGVPNTYVKRNPDGTPVNIAAPHPKSSVISGPSKTTTPQPLQIKVQPSPEVSTDVKSQNYNSTDVCAPVDKQKAPPLSTANKKKNQKGQNDKNSNGSGGSLASMWGRASVKSKPISPPKVSTNPVPVSAEAQICAVEAVEDGGSDDDVNFKRGSNGEGSRKRRVVFDYSDDDEDDNEPEVNLASPDLLIEQREDIKPIVEATEPLREASSSVVKSKNTKVSPSVKTQTQNTIVSPSVKTQTHSPGNDVNKMSDPASNPSKRKKVLKSWIDERGREVTEIVWEGEETKPKKDDTNVAKKDDSSTAKKDDTNVTKKAETIMMKKAETVPTKNAETPVNRAPTAKSSPAVRSNTAAKGGNKKGANAKDAKQGSLMSFFKKV